MSDNKRKYIVEMEWCAGDDQYEPDELLCLLQEAVGMDGYDIKWYSCESVEGSEGRG